MLAQFRGEGGRSPRADSEGGLKQPPKFAKERDKEKGGWRSGQRTSEPKARHRERAVHAGQLANGSV